jgi:hypothetical protein
MSHFLMSRVPATSTRISALPDRTMMSSRCCLALIGLICWSSAGFSADDSVISVALLDAEANYRISADKLAEVRARYPVVAEGLLLETLTGGRQEGVHLITLETSVLKIRIIPTRGMNILDVWDRRTRQRVLGWDSPVHEVVHPKFVNLNSRGGLGWLEGFNEGMCRCGLEFAGGPGKDRFITNTGDIGEMDLTLHGKISNIPASRVELLLDSKHPDRLGLRGTVHERMFFGPKLELVTELWTSWTDSTLLLHDAITNHASAPQEFQLIYHCNFGAPLLQAGAQLVAPLAEVVPMNARAAEGVQSFSSYQGPTAGFVEQVYLLKPLANDAGKAEALLRNDQGTHGVLMSWPVAELPLLTLWKNTAAEVDGYVTGIEPGTSYSYNRRIERAAGRLQKLAAGETREFHISFQFLDSPDTVKTLSEEIQTLQQQHPMELRTVPPQVPE